MAIFQLIIAGVSAAAWFFLTKGGVLGWLGSIPVAILVAKLSEKFGVSPFRLHKKDDDDPFWPMEKYDPNIPKSERYTTK